MTTITVVLGSTREQRTGEWVFNYLKNQAKDLEEKFNIQLDFADLRDFDLPFFYETQAPLANPDRKLPGKQQEWLDLLDSSNGFVFLTPEYNWSTPSVLRNALDYVAHQLQRKAATIISYAPHPGGGFEGGRDLAVLLGKLGAFVNPTSVTLRTIQSIFALDGTLLEGQEATQQLLEETFKELTFYTNLFKNNPYNK